MNYLQLYKKYLPYAMTSSMTMGSFFGLLDIRSEVAYPHDHLMNVMGLVSFGAILGLTYPVSIPVLAGRYLYRNRV